MSRPRDQIGLEGQNVTFPCIATGIPQPSISWWFNNEKLPDHAQTTKDGNLTVYVVKNNAEFEGNYTCKANSKAGIEEETAWLTVDGKLYLLRSVTCTVKPIPIHCKGLNHKLCNTGLSHITRSVKSNTLECVLSYRPHYSVRLLGPVSRKSR